MFAVLGHMVTSAGIRWDGNIDLSGTSYASIKTGISGLSDIPTSGLLQIIAFIGYLEVFVMKDAKGSGEFPGDFRNDFFDFGWNKFTEEEKLRKRGIELNNGRAAMMGTLGLMVHEVIGGDGYIGNVLLGYPTV